MGRSGNLKMCASNWLSLIEITFPTLPYTIVDVIDILADFSSVQTIHGFHVASAATPFRSYADNSAVKRLYYL